MSSIELWMKLTCTAESVSIAGMVFLHDVQRVNSLAAQYLMDRKQNMYG